MLRFFTVSRLALNTNLIFEIGSSFYPEMALFPMSCVLSGFPSAAYFMYAATQTLGGLAHRKNYSFLNWKLPSAFNNNICRWILINGVKYRHRPFDRTWRSYIPKEGSR